mgnify:CR=1 FL=1
MSSPERRKPVARTAAILAAGLAIAAVAGCTVRPLYQAQPGAGLSAPSAIGSQIVVEPVTLRYAQEVRNHLIFLLHGGGKAAADAPYKVSLAVTRRDTTAADSDATNGIMILRVYYTLRDAATNTIVRSGRHSFAAAYDRPRQEFAVARARIDAEDRAARELATILNVVLVQAVEKARAAK